jgi:hypothetical protein
VTTITVNVASAVAANVTVSNGSTVNAAVGNAGAVNVSTGTISPGNATVLSGTLTINSVTTLAAGSQAYVKNDAGTAYAAKLDIGLPAGPATLVSVGNTTTLSPSSNATVTGTTNGSNLTLAFGIPRGAAPSFAIGNVTTGAAGSSASVTATATNSGANVTLDLTIPRGDPGTSGSNGTNGTSVTLSDATPANLGTAAAGNSNLAARADHTHSLPVIAYANLSGVPANFPTNTTLVSGLSAGYSGINHGHNYVQSLNNLTGNLTLAAGSNVTLTTNGSTLTLSSVGGLGANDSVDGGDYVGTIINGITFAVQPSSQTLNLGGVGNWSTGSAVPTSSALFSVGNQAVLATLAFQSFGNGTSGNITMRAASNVASVASATGNVVNVTVPPISSALNMSVASNGTKAMFLTYYSSGGSDISLLLSTTDNGSTWSAINAPANALRIAGASTGFVATTYSRNIDYYGSDTIRQSSDGVNWNTRTIPFGYNASAQAPAWRIAGGGSLFVAVTLGSNVSAYSTNGVSWTSATPPVATGLLDIAYGGGLYVAISTNRSYVTTNGVSWTSGNLPTSDYARVVYEGGRFVATSSFDSTDIATSVDGVTWTLGTLPSSQLWRWVAYAGGYYAALPGSQLSSGQNLAIAAVATNGSANFTASAATSGGGAISYQWQSSTDAGTTWANVTNATSSTLTLTGLTTANSGTRYRAVASATGAESANSQSATLTVI